MKITAINIYTSAIVSWQPIVDFQINFFLVKADERKNLSLPYKVWLKLVDFLEQADVESSELACQAWSDVLTNENFWITKCNEIGNCSASNSLNKLTLC